MIVLHDVLWDLPLGLEKLFGFLLVFLNWIYDSGLWEVSLHFLDSSTLLVELLEELTHLLHSLEQDLPRELEVLEVVVRVARHPI